MIKDDVLVPEEILEWHKGSGFTEFSICVLETRGFHRDSPEEGMEIKIQVFDYGPHYLPNDYGRYFAVATAENGRTTSGNPDKTILRALDRLHLRNVWTRSEPAPDRQ